MYIAKPNKAYEMCVISLKRLIYLIYSTLRMIDT